MGDHGLVAGRRELAAGLPDRAGGRLARDLERLGRLRPMDDDFMRVVYRDNMALTQHTLRVVTGIGDLRVVRQETQRDLKRLAGARSVELDVWAVDSKGRWYDIEVQRGSAARPRRARYHSAAMDLEALVSGAEMEGLPEQWVVFVMEGDPFGEGRGTYLFDRRRADGAGPGLDDGTHVLYVNGSYRGDDALGRLMHDFHQSDPGAMRDALMAERVRYLKQTPEGVRDMCEVFDEIRQEGIEIGEERGERRGIEIGEERGERRGIEIGEERGERRGIVIGEERGERRGIENNRLENLRNLMANLQVSAQEALRLLGIPEDQRARYAEML